MMNKYLEKIAGILPSYKRFGGIKGAIETAVGNPEDKARFVNENIKRLRIAAGKAEQSKARKELAHGAGLIGAGTIASAAGIHALTKKSE